jgi:hypothetical protein
MEQRSPEWDAIRVGKVGGSEGIGLTTDARMTTLIWKKLAELQTGKQEENYVSADMQHGIDTEPIAIAEYEKQYFVEVKKDNYITNIDFKYLGLSPDGLVGDDGAIEVKCPKAKQHCMAIAENKIPTENRPQITEYFLVHNILEWVDFVSYCADVKKKPMFVYRCHRKDFEKEIASMKVNYIKYKTKLEEYMKAFE